MWANQQYADRTKMRKQCSKCGIKKPATLRYFGLHKHGKNGWQARCRKCGNEYMKKYSRIYKAKRLKYRKNYCRTLVGNLRRRFNQIKQRCDNLKNPSYKYYGGRGIKCLFKNADEFVDYVINKLKIDPRGLTIDRINNDGNYEKGNIRFITQAENNKNRGD